MATDLTKKQQALVDYLHEHGPTTIRDLADALGSTGRGIGVMHSKLMWADYPISRKRSDGDYLDDTLSVASTPVSD